MGQFDKRGFNIKTSEDAVEFLELVEAKLPQLVKLVKDSRISQQSLLDRAEHAEKQNQDKQAQYAESTSVGDRLSGTAAPMTGDSTEAGTDNDGKTKEQRLEQLKAAEEREQNTDDVTPPGEIGELHTSTESNGSEEGNPAAAPSGDVTATTAKTPDLTDDSETVDGEHAASTPATDKPVGERVAVKKTSAKKK